MLLRLGSGLPGVPSWHYHTIAWSIADWLWPTEMALVIVQLLLSSCLIVLNLVSSTNAFCKSVPGTPGWPSPAEWQEFNTSLAYQLLQPRPPAAPCHANEPDFNNLTCASI